jgi:predicted enzyme related to lactoylglutathione lyase
MPNPPRFRTGEPCWLDLVTSKPDAAIEFYGGLFGWTVEQAPPGADYRTFVKDGRRVAGLTPVTELAGDRGRLDDGGLDDGGLDDGWLDDGWLVYLAVGDADATATAIREAGGEVLQNKELRGLGRMLIARDATGAIVGAWQSGDHPGFGLTREPGAPMWQELHAEHYAAAVDFYERAFDWDTRVLSDSDELRFTTMGDGANAAAGIMDAAATLPEIERSRWVAYFGVENANESAVRVTDLGGAMLERVEDTPYGRMARASDPSGFTFYIMQVD